jgi:ATPase subunit of ABC transporter with duplicated ATPase domains
MKIQFIVRYMKTGDTHVMPRDKVGIVGGNGAGKTSLFKVLSGAVERHG